MTIFNIYDTRKLFKWAIFVIFGGFLVSLWNRTIYIDDAWFGEQVFWMAKDGIPRTESLKGYFGRDVHLLVYHKFHIIFGVFVVKLFGFSLHSLRISTLFTILFFLIILFNYHKRNQVKFGKSTFYIWIAIFAANPLVIYLAYTYRPEFLVMLFGFLSWMMVEDAATHIDRPWKSLFGGAFAGMAFFTHLNGLIFPIGGFLLLLLNKKYKNVLYFSISAFLFSSLFFYDLWQEGRIDSFLYQMRNWPDPVGSSYVSGGSFSWFINAGLKLLEEHQRFFWSYKVWVVSILYFLSLIIFFKTLFRENHRLFLYLFIINLALNVFGSQIAERFIIYLLPYMAIIIGQAFSLAMQRKAYKVLNLFKGLALVQFVFCFNMIFWLVEKNRNYVEMHNNILAKVPEIDVPVLVDYPFVFDGIKTHKLITFKLFEYLETTYKKKFDVNSFTKKAHDLGVRYIILPLKSENVENADYTYLFSGEKNIPFFEKYLVSDGYMVMKHKD